MDIKSFQFWHEDRAGRLIRIGLTAVLFVIQAIVNIVGVNTYQTNYSNVVTPPGPAFAIWGVVFILQASFIIFQFFSTSKVITSAALTISIAMIVQTIWTGFTFWTAWASFAFTVVLWASVFVPFVQFNAPLFFLRSRVPKDSSNGEFWTLQVLTGVWLGWLTVACALNFGNAMYSSGYAWGGPVLDDATISYAQGVEIFVTVCATLVGVVSNNPAYILAVVWALVWQPFTGPVGSYTIATISILSVLALVVITFRTAVWYLLPPASGAKSMKDLPESEA